MHKAIIAGPDKLTNTCRSEMKSFFDTSIDDIIESIEEQVEQAENDGRCVRVRESRPCSVRISLTKIVEYRDDRWIC
jgi:hypothetical protein